MNALILGTADKTAAIQTFLPKSFLLIDDGAIIDALTIPKRRKVTVFDPAIHSFNPLKGMNYPRARQFINVLDAIFPEGEGTLTKKASNFILLNALLSHPTRLSNLLYPKPKDSAHTDAYQKIQTLLLSPVLKNVLCNPTNISFDGILLARLDRAALGDDCFVLANFLISLYQGQVVIPDFGFYACPFHLSLKRQNRLIAGLNFLDEVSRTMQNNLLLIPDRVGQHCTVKDAETLAGFARLAPHTNGYNEYLSDLIE